MEKQYKKQYKNKKVKIISPTWSDGFVLLDGSYSESDIQYYIKCIIKKLETLTSIPPIHAYIDRINNRLVFKIKNEYKLMPKTMKVFGKTKTLLDKTENGGNVLSLEVVEIILFQCNLVDYQQQQKSEVIRVYKKQILCIFVKC